MWLVMAAWFLCPVFSPAAAVACGRRFAELMSPAAAFACGG
jgi:hypothetical protein